MLSWPTTQVNETYINVVVHQQLLPGPIIYNSQQLRLKVSVCLLLFGLFSGIDDEITGFCFNYLVAAAARSVVDGETISR